MNWSLKIYSSITHLLTFVISIGISLSIITGCGGNEIQYEPNTFIKDWLILGPFPNCDECSTTNYYHDERCKGFFTDYLKSIGGEQFAVPEDGMTVIWKEKNIERTWTKIKSKKDGIHLTNLVPKDMVVAYAFCQIISLNDQKSVLSVGSNDGLQVFLNGAKIHESHKLTGRWLQADNDYVLVDLKKGKNNLMLKIDQGTGDFGFIARFFDYDLVRTDILGNLKLFTSLKAVNRNDTLVASLGTDNKISVLNPSGKVNFEIYDDNKNIIAQESALPGDDIKIPMNGMKEGFLSLLAKFDTPNDGQIQSELNYFNGKLKKHPRVDRITKELMILNEDNQVIFPIGTYGAPVEDYKLLKDVGYNFVVASAENLDKVHEAGLLAAVPVHSSDPQYYYNFIMKYKSHPAILCWMLYDEPGYNKADLLYIYDIYNAAYRADKVHPSYLVITTPTVYKTFGRCCDVLAVDTYPITNGDINEVGENVSLAVEQLENETPVWHCGQMFTWPEQRRPNPQEHRFMTYYALINGAKGLLWYTYKGYGQYLPKDDQILWESHIKLLEEINELSPLFFEKGSGTIVKLVKDNTSITAIVKESPIGKFLIAANKSKTEVYSPSLIVGNDLEKEVIVYNENRKVEITNGILKDNFAPLDVHIYKIKSLRENK